MNRPVRPTKLRQVLVQDWQEYLLDQRKEGKPNVDAENLLKQVEAVYTAEQMLGNPTEIDIPQIATALRVDPQAKQTYVFLWNRADTEFVQQSMFQSFISHVIRVMVASK